MQLISKMGHRIPELIARAAAGDVWALTILIAMGISVVEMARKKSD